MTWFFPLGIIGMNALALLLILLRPKLYHNQLYRPMIKNIKLSVLPIFILLATTAASLLLNRISLRAGALAAGTVGVLVWLLLLPNAGYLVTELNFSHREHDTHHVPLWYDIIAVLSLAVSGVFNTCVNVLLVQALFSVLLDKTDSAGVYDLGIWLVVFLLFFLVAVGIYLGRYLRFNSWDIRHPVRFCRRLKKHFSKSPRIKNFSLFTVLHTLFFTLFYYASMGGLLRQLTAFLERI